MNENYEKTIELIEGYTAKDPSTQQDVTHRSVTFGKRLTAGDLMSLDEDPQARNNTQYHDLIRRKMITKFGSLKMPVALNVLLSLDTIDREDLENAGDKFLFESRGDRTWEILENFGVQLFFGIDIDGTIYDVVRFGNRITGRDEVEADKHGSGVARECFLIGRQISRIETQDGTAFIDGQIDLERFETLDAEDFAFLKVGAENWRQSFRKRRGEFSEKRNGSSNISTNARNENERTGSSESAS